MKDSVFKTLFVAFALCVVCSVLVSTSAVQLRPLQEANKKNDIKKNLLLACKLLDSPKASKAEIDRIYSERVVAKVVDLETGEYSDVDPEGFDAKKDSKKPGKSVVIPSKKDVAKIKRRAKKAKVFIVDHPTDGKLLVLPVHGKGLWSTMWGFLALADDLKTIRGLGFYAHGETPGLGGEIDNPDWKKLWEGKTAMDDNLNPIVQVIKGRAQEGSKTQVDGLSGATLTSNGVTYLVQYWLGGHGFGPFLNRIKSAGL